MDNPTDNSEFFGRPVNDMEMSKFASLLVDHSILLAQGNISLAATMLNVANGMALGAWSKDQVGLVNAVQTNSNLLGQVAQQIFDQAVAHRAKHPAPEGAPQPPYMGGEVEE